MGFNKEYIAHSVIVIKHTKADHFIESLVSQATENFFRKCLLNLQ